MNKLKIDFILHIILTLVELLTKVVNTLMNEKGQEDGNNEIEESRAHHGG